MGDFNIFEVFDGQSLLEIARWTGLSIPVNAVVAVGIAEFDEDVLCAPVVESKANGAFKVDEKTHDRLTRLIVQAADDIIADVDVSYDTAECPVLALGIEDDNAAYGVIFIAVSIQDEHFHMTKSSDELLLGDIEDRIDSIIFESYDLDNAPMISWVYGILADPNTVYNE